MYSVDANTIQKIGKTERKNLWDITADVLYSETFDGVSIVHSRTKITAEWDPQTGKEGAKKAIMESFEKWMKGD